jgi:hypothetical protein
VVVSPRMPVEISRLVRRGSRATPLVLSHRAEGAKSLSEIMLFFDRAFSA